MRQPDDKDRLLLQLVRTDSRAPLKVLGAALGLSTSAVQERLQRLKKEGTIKGYTIWQASPPETRHAYMLVSTQSRQCAEIAPRIEHIGEIIRCDSVAGDIDMVLVLEAKSDDRLQDIRDEIAALPGVKNVITLPRMAERFAR